ncbi:MAG: PD-(D/E)XK motif protein [Betaproteobacteria bacterium]|nr:PD-(D/E)XK motif protein [Betaproteobacteria bacterium]
MVERLKWWQRLLSRGQSGVLGAMELRGLVGELLFLGDYAIPSFGAKLAVDSWVGPRCTSGLSLR